ncbi:MAG: hypothetical protein ACI4MH_00500 [Candidatus Coproplasma sp.]
MIDLNSQEYQKLFTGAAKEQKLNTVMALTCSVVTLLTTIINVADMTSFVKNKTLIIISASVAIALLAVLLVYDIYYLCRYTVKINGVLARWVADIAQSTNLFDSAKELELTCVNRMFALILQNKDGRQIVFDLEPIKSYPNVAYTACGLIFKYVEASAYKRQQTAPYRSVVLHDATGKKVKTRVYVENSSLLKNSGERNYYVKKGIIG